MLAKLLRDKEIGKLVVPIVPDEARTFGMESLFQAVGIYSSIGQLYEPVDMATLLYYKEAKDGQILEEGITEAGSISSWIAAGTAYATHGVNTIPFFIYYSMFGFQRVGDFIWAAADARCRGFLLGGTAGRTTLAGEGLQHQDGNSHTLALHGADLPGLRSGLRLRAGVIIQDGIKRMYGDREDGVLLHHRHERAVRDAGDAEGRAGRHHQGPLPLQVPRPTARSRRRAQLIGSGAILNEVVKAQALLEKYGVGADVWSATSYNELYRDAHRTERWNLLQPDARRRACRTWPSALGKTAGVVVAASDYLKSQPDMISRWFVGRPMVTLGTDGFGRSEDRASLRNYFEVDARHVAAATLSALHREGHDRRDGRAAGVQGSRNRRRQEGSGDSGEGRGRTRHRGTRHEAVAEPVARA